MGDELLQALEQYEQVFDDFFPTVPMSGHTEEEMIDMIDQCISAKKDIYDMGYLDIDGVY